MKVPFVSVVVPVLNRKETIEDCVRALLDQDYPEYEVIIVDNGSTDGTPDIVSRYPVQLIVENRRNPYIARNRGVEASRGEIVAFTDSDCAPHRDWLKQLVSCYETDKIGGAGGELVAQPPSGVVEEYLSHGHLQIYTTPCRTDVVRDPRRFLSGGVGSANMSYKRSVLAELGGFAEHFARFCGSYDFSWRAQRAGYRIVFEPKALVYHRMRGTVFSMCAQFYAFGRGQAHLLKSQPEKAAYFTIKMYIRPPIHLRLRLPFRALVNVDPSYLLPLAVVLSPLHRWFAVFAIALALMLLVGGAVASRGMARRAGSAKWYVLAPLLHLLQTYALAAGRIVGGIKHRVVAT